MAMIPLMCVFSKSESLAKLPGYDFNQFTLGNLGGSSISCVQAKFNSAKTDMQIDCPWNTLISVTAIAQNTNKAIYDAGILNSADKVSTYCSNDAFEDPDDCTQYLNGSFK